MVAVKMTSTVQLCLVLAAAMSVVLVVEHVEAREVYTDGKDIVSSLLPEESLNRTGNSHSSSERRGWQRARQHIYSSHHTQEEPDASVMYRVNHHPRDRYIPPGGGAETRNLHTVAAAHHEPRTLQPVRIESTGSLIMRDSVHNPSPISKARTAGDETFSSRVPQMGLRSSTNNRRRLPNTQDFDEARVHPSLRERLQRPPPQQNTDIQNTESDNDARLAHTSLKADRSEHMDSTSLAASRSTERPVHQHPRSFNTHTLFGISREPSTTITRGSSWTDIAEEHLRTQDGVSEISDEVRNNMQQQRLDQPDRCCGSQVPLDPRTARLTGTFQRVASAGSIKVVQLPDLSSFPPSEVRDLQAMLLDPLTLSLTWTAPGEDLDSGTASGYIIRLSEARHDLEESQFDAAPEETLLETSEMLTAAGVYQAAGTAVGVEVPLRRHLQRGHVYYVALKALDNYGYSSVVSNVAQFTIPESSMNDNTAASNTGTGPLVEDSPSTSSSHGSTNRNGDVVTHAFSERDPEPLPARDSDLLSEPQEELRTGSISTSRGSEKSESKQKRRKDRKKKNKKSKRRKKGGRKSGRRRSNRQRENSDTLVQDLDECEVTLLSEQEHQEPISLCDAQHSLTLAITYFTQNNEYQYLDYLSAALHTLEQKMQPSWKSGGRREAHSSLAKR